MSSEYTDLAMIIQGMWRYRNHSDWRINSMARRTIRWAIRRYRDLDQDWRDRVLAEDPRDSVH